MPHAEAEVDTDSVEQLSTPTHLNINKISREVRRARPQACRRLIRC